MAANTGCETMPHPGEWSVFLNSSITFSDVFNRLGGCILPSFVGGTSPSLCLGIKFGPSRSLFLDFLMKCALFLTLSVTFCREALTLERGSGVLVAEGLLDGVLIPLRTTAKWPQFLLKTATTPGKLWMLIQNMAPLAWSLMDSNNSSLIGNVKLCTYRGDKGYDSYNLYRHCGNYGLLLSGEG